MKTEYIRKDWLFWLMVLSLGGLAALLGGSVAWAVFNFLVHAPSDVAIGFGVGIGIIFFLHTLSRFGVRIDPGIGPF